MTQDHSGTGDNLGGDKYQETTHHVSDSRFGGGYTEGDYIGDVNNNTYNTNVERDAKGVIGHIENSPITQNFYHNPPQEKRDKNQLDLIKYSKDTATRLLSQSLRNQVYITLNKMVDETKVIPAMQLKRGNQTVESLPSGTSIVEVYDRREDIQGRLLILGKPGSGKSTALYKLAKTLAERAERDINHPIPLLFNLSSWTNHYTTIKDWLMYELNIQHGFSQKLAKEYLEKELIIPLLDGLDELRGDRQAACVEAINEFLLPRNWKNPLVVCSRLQEFELLNTRIGLKGSVILQPLSDAQIKDYLQEMKAVTIQQLIENDEDWRALAQTPLFLDIMVLVNDKLSSPLFQIGRGVGGEGNKKISYLMEIYLQERLEHVGYWQSKYEDKIRNSQKWRQKSLTSYLRYVKKPQQTRHYLAWIARQLESNKQTIFLIEKLQPTDLANKGQRRIYSLILDIIFTLIGGLIWGFAGELVFGSIIGLFIGLVVGLNDNVKTVEALKFSWSGLRKCFFFWLYIGGWIGIAMWFTLSHISLIEGLIVGLSLGFIVSLFFCIIFGLKGVDLEIKNQPNQGIKSSVYNMILAKGLLVNLGLLLYIGLRVMQEWLNQIVQGGLFDALRGFLMVTIFFSFFYSPSGIAVLQHLSLRLVLTFNGYTPWNYAHFLDYCTEQLLLQRVGGGYRFIHRLLQEHLISDQ